LKPFFLDLQHWKGDQANLGIAIVSLFNVAKREMAVFVGDGISKGRLIIESYPTDCQIVKSYGSSFCWYNWQNGLGYSSFKYLRINLGCDVITCEDEETNSIKKEVFARKYT